MKKRTQYYRRWLVVIGLALMAAFSSAANAAMTGIDQLADNLSVPDFSVNGTGGFNADEGGGSTPGPALPEKWYPGLTVHVVWKVRDWQHDKWTTHEADVPVDPYTEDGGHVWVHFLSDGTVRVVVSDMGPRSPNYPGPHDPIPTKNPWDTYPPRIDWRDMSEQLLDDRIFKQQCMNEANPKGCENQANEKLLDEQRADARRYLPRCASITTGYVYEECEDQARQSMRAARLARRCRIAPSLPACTTQRPGQDHRRAETTGAPDQ